MSWTGSVEEEDHENLTASRSDWKDELLLYVSVLLERAVIAAMFVKR
jgi:hypothetical protein